jgi:microcystin-dependent protein
MEIRNYLNCKEIFLSNKMVLFDNVEIGNLDKSKPHSAATLDYVDTYLPEKGIYIQNTKLGIKNSNPQDDLDVSGVINSKALKTNLLTVWNPNNTANQDAIINLNVAGSSSGNPFIGMNIYNENNAQWSLGIDNVDNLFKIKSNSDFSGTGRLVLNQSGFLGIGVEAPTAPIHLSNTISNKKILLYDVTGNNHQFTGLGLETNGALRYQVNQSGVDHIFYSGTTSISSTELMRIKGTGKVGINESNPTTARLTVNTGNVDEFGLSLVTTLANGKGAGIELDNRGSGGRNYGIYSGNNGSVNIYDKTTNQVFFQTGVTGTQIQGTTNVTGTTNIEGTTNIYKTSGNSSLVVSQLSNTQDRSTINFVKGTTGQNEWSMNLDNSGNFSIMQVKRDGTTISNNSILAKRSGDVEITNLNTIGKIKEDGFELIPVGTILPYAGSTEPPGYIFCDGRSILRTPTNNIYFKLSQVLGVTYGGNINSSIVPDLRCRVPVGSGTLSETSSGVPVVSAKSIGTKGGQEKIKLTKNEMPTHNHTGTTTGYNYTHAKLPGNNFASNHLCGWYAPSEAVNVNHTHGIPDDGGDQPHNNMQPYLVINYIIKY